METLWTDVKTLLVGVSVVVVITATILITSCKPEKVAEQAIINEVNEVKEDVTTQVEEVKTEVDDALNKLESLKEGE